MIRSVDFKPETMAQCRQSDPPVYNSCKVQKMHQEKHTKKKTNIFHPEKMQNISHQEQQFIGTNGLP